MEGYKLKIVIVEDELKKVKDESLVFSGFVELGEFGYFDEFGEFGESGVFGELEDVVELSEFGEFGVLGELGDVIELGEFGEFGELVYGDEFGVLVESGDELEEDMDLVKRSKILKEDKGMRVIIWFLR